MCVCVLGAENNLAAGDRDGREVSCVFFFYSLNFKPQEYVSYHKLINKWSFAGDLETGKSRRPHAPAAVPHWMESEVTDEPGGGYKQVTTGLGGRAGEESFLGPRGWGGSLWKGRSHPFAVPSVLEEGGQGDRVCQKLRTETKPFYQ